jgi:dihydrolipoamide dehydrogenase
VEYLLKSSQVEVIRGTARLGAVGLVEVKDEEGSLRTVEAEKVILATGSLPALIPGVTVDGQRIMTSDEALNLKELPQEILIVGASVVGVEFATIFNQLGSKVTLVEMLPRIVMTEDDEIADLLARHLKRNGVDLLVGYRVDKVSSPGNGPIAISVSSRDEVRELKANTVLIAIGRKPNTTGLNLEAVGVGTEKGFIKVNEQMETNVPGIYAIGDVVGGLLLAHVASAEGIVAAENAAGMGSTMDYRAVPSCIFTSPEIAHVGLTEKEARERGHEVKVGKFPFTASSKALAEGEREGLVKMVIDKTYGEILGVHIMGPSASTVIAEAALAMNLEATPKEIYETIHAHPTLNEALMEAALDVDGLAIHLPRKTRS